MSDLGMRLQTVRKKSDWSPSQIEVSKALNIAQSTYARFESGLREPPISFIIQFCKLFSVSSDYLLGLSDSQPQPSSIGSFLNASTPRDPFCDLTPEQRIVIESSLKAFRAANAAAVSQQEA